MASIVYIAASQAKKEKLNQQLYLCWTIKLLKCDTKPRVYCYYRLQFFVVSRHFQGAALPVCVVSEPSKSSNRFHLTILDIFFYFMPYTSLLCFRMAFCCFHFFLCVCLNIRVSECVCVHIDLSYFSAQYTQFKMQSIYIEDKSSFHSQHTSCWPPKKTTTFAFALSFYQMQRLPQ